MVRYPHFLLDTPSYVCPGWPALVLDNTIVDMQGRNSTLLFLMARRCPRITHNWSWLELRYLIIVTYGGTPEPLCSVSAGHSVDLISEGYVGSLGTRSRLLCGTHATSNKWVQVNHFRVALNDSRPMTFRRLFGLNRTRAPS